MGIGGSILLIVVGAILTFGLENSSLGPFNLDVIGWILQLAGLVVLGLTLYFWNTRRRASVPPPPPAAGASVPPPPPAAGDPVARQRYTDGQNY